MMTSLIVTDANHWFTGIQETLLTINM